MKLSSFKIRKLAEVVDPSDSSAKKPSDTDQLRDAVQQTNARMGQLMSLFETFMKTSIGNISSAKSTSQASPIIAEHEVRDRHIYTPLPQLQNITQQQAEKWITDVCFNTFSASFHYFLTEQMTFEQTKVYCSETILRNLLKYVQKFKLTEKDIENLNKHIGSNVFSYLQKKYPLTQSSDVNKTLQNEVQQTDHLNFLVNDFLFNSNIMFKYREDGNYNDLIMRVINKAIQDAESPSPYSTADREKSNYSDFQKQITKLFESVFNQEWMFNIKTNQGTASYKHISQSHRQKYQEKVKAYTTYAIGRKISENTSPYTENEIQSKNLIIKSPAILRILTKWCQQLWNKFDNQNYFIQRTESLQLQNPQYINPFFKWMKAKMDELAKEQKAKILAFKTQIDKNSYHQQAQFLLKHLQQDNINSIPKYQKASGKFATQMLNNLHSYIILYLNRLIHGLMTVSKTFFDKSVQKSWQDWQSPPNLMTFRIGDLLRCKIASKEKEIVRIFKEIKNVSEKNPNRMKIVRIKNRLKQGTRDVLINIKFNNLIICQIQLEVINKEKSKFIQCSNKFAHYIYEMRRSIFGPVSQLCSIWNTFEPRASQYKSLLKILSKQQIKADQCADNKKQHNFVRFDLPFQCSSCNMLYYHNNYIVPNKKCTNCSKYKCAKCQINVTTEDQLKKIIFNTKKDKKLAQCCQRASKEIPLNGVCIKIESTVISKEVFKLTTYEGKRFILSLKQQKIYNIKSIYKQKDIDQFLDKYCVFSINKEASSFIDITPKMIQNFLVQEYLKDSLMQEKEILILTGIKFTVPEFIELMKITESYPEQCKKIKRLQFAGNYIPQAYFLKCFPNITSVNLNSSSFLHLLYLLPFKSLQKLQLCNNDKVLVFNEQICTLPKIQQIKMSQAKIQKIPENIVNLTNLTSIIMNINKISKIPESMCYLSKLKCISLNRNSLTAIPENIGKLTSLKKLSLRQNQISTLPQSIKQLSTLQILDISKNKFAQISNNFKLLPSLQTLKLQQNQISSIPQTLEFPLSLKCLGLNNNKLTKLPPECFKASTKLQTLNLHFNQIQLIPETLKECQSIVQLTLNHNKLSAIPSWFNLFKSLSTVIDYSQNCLKQFPSFIFELQNATSINLRKNQITSIPKEIQKLQQLKVLKLSYNKIKTLASELTTFGKGFVLEFDNNQIEVVPSFIKQVVSSIATWGNSLKFNKVSLIDSSELFDAMGKLIVFTNNELTSIPMSLINHKDIIVTLNFQSNKIKQIPRDIKLFINLNYLYLANNLIEVVPKQIEDLTKIIATNLRLENNPIKQVECIQFCMKVGNTATKTLLKSFQQTKQKS